MFSSQKEFATHEDLKTYIKKVIDDTKMYLPYITQASYDYQLMVHLGYYQGYAAAKNWTPDILFIFDQINPLPTQNSSNTSLPIKFDEKPKFEPLAPTEAEKKKKFKPSINVPKLDPPTHDYGQYLGKNYRN